VEKGHLVSAYIGFKLNNLDHKDFTKVSDDCLPSDPLPPPHILS